MKNLIEITCIEYQKSRHRFLSTIWISILLFQLVFMLWNMKEFSNPSQGWKAQLYNMTLLNSMLMPVIISVFASRLMDMEHKAGSWKLLKTMQAARELFMGKLLYGGTGILLFCLVQVVGLLGVGRYYSFPDPIPFPQYALYCISTFFICFILFCLQLLLSFVRANQAIALSIGLGGSLIGLFISFFPRGILYQLIPWGLFGAASIVGMDWSRETRVTDFYFTSPVTGTYIAIVLWLFLLLFLGLKLFSAYEVEESHFALLPYKNSKGRRILNRTYSAPKRLSLLPLEWIKLKRSPLWIAFILLPCISAFSGTFNYLANIEILQDKWYSLWTQHSLFFCALFMPALLAVYCSYLWQLEYKEANLSQLLVLTPPVRIVTGKLLTSAFLLSLTLFWQFFLFFICGKLVGISVSLPKELVSWFLCGFAGGAAVCSVHIFLSLVIPSFALPVALSAAGGIAGLLFAAKGIWYLLPYSLFYIGMRANDPNMELNLLQFISACFIFILIPYLSSILYLTKTDVRT